MFKLVCTRDTIHATIDTHSTGICYLLNVFQFHNDYQKKNNKCSMESNKISWIIFVPFIQSDYVCLPLIKHKLNRITTHWSKVRHFGIKVKNNQFEMWVHFIDTIDSWAIINEEMKSDVKKRHDWNLWCDIRTVQ